MDPEAVRILGRSLVEAGPEMGESQALVDQAASYANLDPGVRHLLRGTEDTYGAAGIQLPQAAGVADTHVARPTIAGVSPGALSGADRALLNRARTSGGGHPTATGPTNTDNAQTDYSGADRVLLNRDPLGIAPIAARMRALSDAAENGDISDNDPRIDAAVADLRRQVAKHTDAETVPFVLLDILRGKSGQQAIANHNPRTGPTTGSSRDDRPDWSNPHLLTDAELMASITNWPGTDNDPILDGLVREFDTRAEPEGGWITLGQHQLVTDDFTARANGNEETLETFDRVGAQLVDELTEAGFDDATALDIAAHLRAQFRGDEIALQAGLDAALAEFKDNNESTWRWTTDAIDFDKFDETLATAGGDAVIGYNRDFYEVGRAAIDTAAAQSGHDVTDEGVAQILAYAVRNGVSVAAAARQFFGVDPDRPPAGVTKKEVLDPEVVEIEVRIVQEEATIEALTKLQDMDAVDAVISALPSIHQMDDFDGDGIADYTVYGDGKWGPAGGHSGTTELDQIVELVTAVTSIASDERLANQVGFTEHLKDVQQGVAVAANGHELNFLDEDQVELIERIESYGPEIHGLMLAPSYDANGDPYPNELAALEALLDELDASNEHGYSPGFLAAMRELLDDPELVEHLAFTGSNDLSETPFDLDEIDLTRVKDLDKRIAFAEILAPYTGNIDTNGDGVTLPKDLEGFIRTAQENPDLAIPRRVIEAAQAAIVAGYTDRSVLGDLRIMLDIIGATEIPVVSQLADATNAGLYLVVDRDLVNAGISAVGLVATGAVALRAGTKGVRQFQASAEVLEALAKEGGDLVDIGAVITRADGLIDDIGTVYVNGDAAAGTLVPIVRGTENGKTVVIVDIGNGPEILRAGSGSLTLPSGETIRVTANGRVMHFSGSTPVPSGNATSNSFARVFGPEAGAGLQRPYIQNSTLDEIITNTPVDANGNVLESFMPGAPIVRDLDGTPVNINIRESFHIGHVSGSEHRRLVAAAEELGLNQSQLNSFVNAHPGGLQIEGPLRNQSHMDELPGVGNLDRILDDMRIFFDL